MADDFVDAPDYPPGSEPHRRQVESRVGAVEDKVEILLKNLRSLSRSNAAGMKATHLRISKLGGINIPPGTPIDIHVYPYAYFDPSGYPRGGARITWGDQNDADHYQIWIRRATAPDDIEYSGFSLVQSSDIGTADVRNLEVLTEYELMMRAVSPGGSYGFFTGVYYFTTPNETTWIPWLGDPIVIWHEGGFASIQWEFSDTYVPAYTESIVENTPTMVSISGSLGADPVPANNGNGVLAPNGKIYYPPGEGFVTESTGAILLPNDAVVIATDYDLSAPAADGGVMGGILGEDGLIYWVTHEGTDTYLLQLNTVSETITATSLGVDVLYRCMTKGADGRIYCLPSDPATDDFLIIHVGGTTSFSDLGFTAASGETWGDGVLNGNSEIWHFPNDSGTDFLVIDTNAAIPLATRVPMDHTGLGSAGSNTFGQPVLTGDGSIYALSRVNSTGDANWYRISDSGEQAYGGQLDSALYVTRAIYCVDGKIRAFGDVNEVSVGYTVFDPTTGEFSIEIIDSPTAFFAFYGDPVLDLNGRIWLRNGKQGGEPWAIQEYPFVTLDIEVIEHPATGSAEIPNYLKHMQVQKSTETGWETIATLAEPGYVMDPFAQIGDAFRFVPLSTAGTQGTPSAVVEVTF